MDKNIRNVITSLYAAFTEELMSKTEDQLEEYWHFKYDKEESKEIILYKFHRMLVLYGDSCRRWEEGKNGTCCVVERVRDKYLMPKIKEFLKDFRG